MKGETDMSKKKFNEAEFKEFCKEAIPHITEASGGQRHGEPGELEF